MIETRPLPGGTKGTGMLGCPDYVFFAGNACKIGIGTTKFRVFAYKTGCKQSGRYTVALLITTFLLSAN
jgi:hypothetical protein